MQGGEGEVQEGVYGVCRMCGKELAQELSLGISCLGGNFRLGPETWRTGLLKLREPAGGILGEPSAA